MRKYSVAGRLMENGEGETAAEACEKCLKKGVDCVVPKDAEVGEKCALCTRNQWKCNASRLASEGEEGEELSVEERLSIAESKIMALETVVKEQKDAIEALLAYKGKQETWASWAHNRLLELCGLPANS